jgi:hypothetical protein
MQQPAQQQNQIPPEVQMQLISQMLNGAIGGGGQQVQFGNRREEY